MELNHLEVRHILEKKGLTHLYHANTTQTAITFIENGGLLSRGAVEHYGLMQTEQSSDLTDKMFNVWNDIFVDSLDLHEKFNRQNFYGPILFKLSLEVFNQDYDLSFWVTKDNPIRWYNGQVNSDRYIQNLKEFEEIYANGSYREMLTFRNTYSHLPFIPFLKEIIIDNPDWYWESTGESFFDTSKTLIQDAMMKSPYDYSNVKILKRECENCYCSYNYNNRVSYDQMIKLFGAF